MLCRDSAFPDGWEQTRRDEDETATAAEHSHSSDHALPRPPPAALCSLTDWSLFLARARRGRLERRQQNHRSKTHPPVLLGQAARFRTKRGERGSCEGGDSGSSDGEGEIPGWRKRKGSQRVGTRRIGKGTEANDGLEMLRT